MRFLTNNRTESNEILEGPKFIFLYFDGWSKGKWFGSEEGQKFESDSFFGLKKY